MQVVVSTDVLARGVDLERVNLVVNLDLPVSE
jgi:superfamily II DNA/RNA helicase